MTQKQQVKNSSFDEDLQEELSELDMYGDDEGRVECEVVKVKKSRGKAKITFDPPVGDSFTKTTDIPRTKEDDSLLLRILQDKGYGLVAADEIIGEDVKFTRKHGNWEYDNKSRLGFTKSVASYFTTAGDIYEISPDAGPERLSDSFRIASLIIGLPFVSTLAFIILVTGENVGADDYAVGFMISLLSTILWVGAVSLLFFV